MPSPSGANSSIVYAKKEVILTAGAIDSPKLLLLSGIGPKTELAKHGVDTFLDLPGVGKNLQDHLWIELVTVQKPNSPHRTSYINSPASLEEARAQYAKDNSGDLAGYYLPQMIAYLKNNRLIHSEEFQDLDEATKRFFLAETRPHYELISVSSISQNIIFNPIPQRCVTARVVIRGAPHHLLIRLSFIKLTHLISTFLASASRRQKSTTPLP